MIRSYRYRVYPTKKQIEALDEQLSAACDLYNAALEQRIRAYYEHGMVANFASQCIDLTEARQDNIFPEGMSRTSQVDVLHRIDKAFNGFFRRCSLGQIPGFPRFKSRSRYVSLTWRPSDGASIRNNKLRIMGIGCIRVKWHRNIPLDANIRTITVKKQNDQWYLILVLCIPDLILPMAGKSIGIDRGVTIPFSLSTGEHVEGPRAKKTGAPKVRRSHRRVARRKRGSNRHRKASVLLAKEQEKEANRRRNFVHKLSRQLVNENDLIIFENLNSQAMTKSASGTIDIPGRNVAQKRGLNREILDQGWAMLVQMTIYKAEEAGRQVIMVPAPYTSQTCYDCGVIDKKSRSGTVFRCTACGHIDHADTNAAKNILRAGLALQALT
jgi:putative transposase